MGQSQHQVLLVCAQPGRRNYCKERDAAVNKRASGSRDRACGAEGSPSPAHVVAEAPLNVHIVDMLLGKHDGVAVQELERVVAGQHMLRLAAVHLGRVLPKL